MSIALVLGLGSTLLAGAIGYFLTKGSEMAEKWAAFCMLIQLAFANVLNRFVFLDQMAPTTATFVSVGCGLAVVVVSSLIFRSRLAK